MRENWKRIHRGQLSLAPIRSLGPHVSSDSHRQHLTHFTPIGTRFFREKNSLYWIRPIKDGDVGAFEIATLGSHKALTRLLDTMDEVAGQVTSGSVKLMLPDTNLARVPWWNPWKSVGWINPTTLEALAIENDLRTGITRQVQSFLEHGERQLGILLHGPPGTGKSSLAKAIACKFHLPLYQMSLNGLEGNALYSLSTKIQQRSVLLLEDIDRAHISQGEGQFESKEFGKRAIDLASLLNLMDGAAAPQSTVIIMTANDVEKLPPVLIRPGRIDLRIKMGLATATQVQDIFLSIFKHQGYPYLEERAEQFRKIVPSDTLSPATIENFLKQNERTPDTAVKDAEDWVKAVTFSGDGLAVVEHKSTLWARWGL